MYNVCTIMYTHIRSQASDWNCCVKRETEKERERERVREEDRANLIVSRDRWGRMRFDLQSVFYLIITMTLFISLGK